MCPKPKLHRRAATKSRRTEKTTEPHPKCYVSARARTPLGSYASRPRRPARRITRLRGVYGAGMEPCRPLVLVDVDGVLNPARSHAPGYRGHWAFPAA